MKHLLAVAIAMLMVSMPFTFAIELHLTYDLNGNVVSGDVKYRVYNSPNQLTAVIFSAFVVPPNMLEHTRARQTN